MIADRKTREARRRAGLLLFVLCGGACGSAPAPRATTPAGTGDARGVPHTTIAGELAGALDAGTAPEEPEPEPPHETCFPSPGHPCAPDRPRPTILLDVDLTPTDGGFPAISADGATLAVARVDADGARGAPNLTIVLLRVADGAEVQRLPVLTADEGARAEDDHEQEEDALGDAVRSRVRTATAVLSRGAYTSLVDVAFASANGAAAQADARGLHFAFDGAGTVVVTGGGHERARVALPSAAGLGRCAAAGARPGAPEGAFVDVARGLVVVHVVFRGAAGCAEPPPADVVGVLAP